MAATALTSPLRQIVEQRLLQLSDELEGLVDGTRESARRELAEQLNMMARRLRLAPDANELCVTLADAAGAFAGGAALFHIDGPVARGGPVRGLSEAAAEEFQGLEIALSSAAALAGAVETRDPVTAVTSPSEVSAELAGLAGHIEDGRASVFPIVVRDRVPALLYVWGEVQGPFVELLAQLAGAVWSAMPEPAPPELVTIAPAPAEAKPVSAWDALSAEDQQIHLRAQRFARVQVAEVRLSASEAVQAGRAERKLYETLCLQIDAARARFRQLFFAPCPSMVDYLHLELVRTLANDDAELLGKDYPGPMV